MTPKEEAKQLTNDLKAIVKEREKNEKVILRALGVDVDKLFSSENQKHK